MKKLLFETNPYMKDPATRDKALARNIVSSSASEEIWVKRDTKNGCFVSSATDSDHIWKSRIDQR